MSYILDALRKADRDRPGSRVPTLSTNHGGAPLFHWLPWAWAAAGTLAVSVVAVYTLWGPGRPERLQEAARSPVTASGTAAVIASADARPSPPPLARAPARPAREDPAPGVGPSPLAVERPATGDDAARPRVTPTAPPAKTPPAARPVDERPRAAAAAPSPEAPAARRVGAASSRAPVSRSASVGDGIPVSRPGSDSVAPPAVALAPGPSPEAAAGRVTRPGAGESLTQFTLDVLVYSDAPAERMVFINGRKYVEGQAVNEDVVVEQITPDGAVLRHQGRSFVLRPKLNPYTRPRSP